MTAKQSEKYQKTLEKLKERIYAARQDPKLVKVISDVTYEIRERERERIEAELTIHQSTKFRQYFSALVTCVRKETEYSIYFHHVIGEDILPTNMYDKRLCNQTLQIDMSSDKVELTKQGFKFCKDQIHLS